MKKKILLIDDDRLVRSSVQEVLTRAGYDVVSFTNGQDAVDAFDPDIFKLILCDMKMPGLSGIEVLKKIRSVSKTVPFIIMTAYGTIDTAVEAMQHGAYDFMEKPFSSPDALEIRVMRALELGALREENKTLKKQLGKKYKYIGSSKVVKDIDKLVKTVAGSRSTVLITGESGTGKELIARSIHMNSNRKNEAFIKINCAALPENLIESELFGHKKGAFTGALRDTKGKFELASGGTLLLDEIGEMPISLQSKLLRVLQEREIDKVGGEHPVEVDVRVIATTNRNLGEEIVKGNFREDLYYRLNVVPIHLAPLRERTSDIEELVNHFIVQFNEENGFAVDGITKDAVTKLKSHKWSGNVRELENAVERAVVLKKSGMLDADLFLLHEIKKQDNADDFPSGITIAEMEKRLIYKTLEKCGGNKTKTADMLDISIRTLRNKLQEYES